MTQTPPTMIEAVARAIVASEQTSFRRIGFDDLDDEIRTIVLRMARAAIEAMREPSFEMKMAGAEAITAQIMKANANYDGACDAWQAMIQAALGEAG